MPLFHTGYFVKLQHEPFTAEDYTNRKIDNPKLAFKKANYQSTNWFVEWEYSNYWQGLEFLINASSFEVAQNTLSNVLCAAAVIEGVVSWSNEPHTPLEYGIHQDEEKFDLNREYLKGFSSDKIPLYFKLAAIADSDIGIVNSLVKYQLSTEIYSKHQVDLEEEIDWKTTDYEFIQMRFGHAITLSYSVIEELGLEVRTSKNQRSRTASGEWNQEVLNGLKSRLQARNIDLDNNFPWFVRGEKTKLESERLPEIIEKAKWADPDNYSDPYYLRIEDGYVRIPDAIQYLSYLRSRISAHRVGSRIKKLSVFDVANAQRLTRKLILEASGL